MHTLLDKFGRKISIGDLLLYSKESRLIFGHIVGYIPSYDKRYGAMEVLCLRRDHNTNLLYPSLMSDGSPIFENYLRPQETIKVDDDMLKNLLAQDASEGW